MKCSFKKLPYAPNGLQVGRPTVNNKVEAEEAALNMAVSVGESAEVPSAHPMCQVHALRQ